jgi:ABC-2 type transport system ATP-binding protein
MQLLTGQIFPTAGTVEVFGAPPAESSHVLRQLCFVAESQKYPESIRGTHVLRTAPWFFERWDADLAASLVEGFQLPVDRPIKEDVAGPALRGGRHRGPGLQGAAHLS